MLRGFVLPKLLIHPRLLTGNIAALQGGVGFSIDNFAGRILAVKFRHKEGGLATSWTPAIVPFEIYSPDLQNQHHQ